MEQRVGQSCKQSGPKRAKGLGLKVEHLDLSELKAAATNGAVEEVVGARAIVPKSVQLAKLLIAVASYHPLVEDALMTP